MITYLESLNQTDKVVVAPNQLYTDIDVFTVLFSDRQELSQKLDDYQEDVCHETELQLKKAYHSVLSMYNVQVLFVMRPIGDGSMYTTIIMHNGCFRIHNSFIRTYWQQPFSQMIEELWDPTAFLSSKNVGIYTTFLNPEN